jgi:hypothetical protein
VSSVSATYYLPGVVPHSYDEKENVCQYFHCLLCVLFVFYLCYLFIIFSLDYLLTTSLTHLLTQFSIVLYILYMVTN